MAAGAGGPQPWSDDGQSCAPHRRALSSPPRRGPRTTRAYAHSCRDFLGNANLWARNGCTERTTAIHTWGHRRPTVATINAARVGCARWSTDRELNGRGHAPSVARIGKVQIAAFPAVTWRRPADAASANGLPLQRPSGGAMAAACTEMAYIGLRTLSWMGRVTLWRSRGRNPKEAGRVSLGGQIGSLPPLILGTRRGPPPHGRQRPLHGRRRAASAGRVWAFGWRGFRLPSREGDESPSPPPRPPLGQAPLPACNAASSRSPLRVRHESFPPRASFLARSTVLYFFFYRVHLHTGHTPRSTTEGPLTPFVQAVPFRKAPARGTGRLLGCGARPHSLPATTLPRRDDCRARLPPPNRSSRLCGRLSTGYDTRAVPLGFCPPRR